MKPMEYLELILGMTITGIMIGLGQLLGSDDKITPRLVIGRALSSVGLALIAGVVFLQFPEAPTIVIIGFAALFASLGTSALERFVQRIFGLSKP